jgi:hypothetical protein
MLERIREVSPQISARIAGGLYIFTLLVIQWTESLFHGRFDFAIGILTIVGMSAVTLFLYRVFKPVNRNLSLLAAFCNFTGIALEAIRLNPHGTETAMVFHGFFCLLIGYLIFKSLLVPRILGALMAFAGLAWLTYLIPGLALGLDPSFSPGLVNSLSPFNMVCGVLSEASVFLWFLGTGIDVGQLKDQAGKANASVHATKTPSLARRAGAPAQP